MYRDAGVLVYGIHRGEDETLLAEFAAQTGVTFPLVRDEGSIGTLSFPPGVGYPYPRDVVIGKDLVIRSIANSFDLVEMDELVQRLLAE